MRTLPSNHQGLSDAVVELETVRDRSQAPEPLDPNAINDGPTVASLFGEASLQTLTDAFICDTLPKISLVCVSSTLACQVLS